MADVSHVNPGADQAALRAVYDRGPTVAADGGRRDVSDEEASASADEKNATGRTPADEEASERTRMRDVDHTPPYGDGTDVDRVFERGGTEEPVESEE